MPTAPIRPTPPSQWHAFKALAPEDQARLDSQARYLNDTFLKHQRAAAGYDAKLRAALSKEQGMQLHKIGAWVGGVEGALVDGLGTARCVGTFSPPHLFLFPTPLPVEDMYVKRMLHSDRQTMSVRTWAEISKKGSRPDLAPMRRALANPRERFKRR